MAEPLVVVRNGATFTVPVERSRSYPAADVVAMAQAMGYQADYESIRMDGESVRFTADSPFFLIGGDIFQLPNPTYRHGSQLMVPVSWATDWLPTHRSRRWRNMDGRLVERKTTVMVPAKRESWLVVIDAGHGGADPGTIGVGGTKEKDVTLAVAKRLARRLKRESGVEVVLTRDRDTLIALADRPRITRRVGKQAAPDLFLSIHSNSMPKKPSTTRGFESYFLAVAKTEEARRVAMRENEAIKFEEGGEPKNLELLQFILSDLQTAGNLRESSLFAAAINRSMSAGLTAPDLGVKQGPFAVLVGSTVPAVLVEVGYLSNRDEEKLLRSSSYQAKIADALANAIVDYLADYGRRVWSSYSSGR
jgi:N-acetylmuramoyl-L-alanine amidase